MAKKKLDALVPELLAQLAGAPSNRVGILGSTSFFHPSTETICSALGRQLTEQAHLTLLTGGMPGVAEAVARSFCQAEAREPVPTYQLQPAGFEPGPYGQMLVAGQTLEQRRWLLAQLASVYVVLEGGPGTAQEVKWAIQAGAIVIPVACTGGVAAQLYAAINGELAKCAREGDRQSRLTPAVRHALNSPEPWRVLNQHQDIATLIDAIMTLLHAAWETGAAAETRSPVQLESPLESSLNRAIAPDGSHQSDTSIRTLKGLDFRGQQLEGQDFRGDRLINVNFEGANLKGANFSGAELIHVCFNQAVLSRADFSNARLHRVQGIGMKACDADFTRVQFYEVNFSQANLYGASFYQVETHPADATVLSEAEIEGDVLLREADNFRYTLILHEAELLLINAQDASFDQVWLSKANASWANLSGSLWTSSMLHHVNLEGANLTDATLRGCQFQSAIAHLSIWSQSRLIHCNFEGMETQESIWTDARFEGCQLCEQQIQVMQCHQEKKPRLAHQAPKSDTGAAQTSQELLEFWDDRSSQMPLGPTVLIVDDSITVRELLKMSFAKGGYRVKSARDGQDAWEKLKAGLHCDVIFCDTDMPRMSGYDLLEKLKQDPQFQSIPVAILTSRGIERMRRPPLWHTLGAAAFFTKPYVEEILLEATARLLQGETLWTSGTDSSTEFMAQTQQDRMWGEHDGR